MIKLIFIVLLVLYSSLTYSSSFDNGYNMWRSRYKESVKGYVQKGDSIPMVKKIDKRKKRIK